MPIGYDDYVEVRNTAGFDKYYTVGKYCMLCLFETLITEIVCTEWCVSIIVNTSEGLNTPHSLHGLNYSPVCVDLYPIIKILLSFFMH